MKTFTQDPLQVATERSQRYWVSDGIPLIVMGAFWLLWGSVLLLPIVFPSRTLVRFFSILVICAIALFAILMRPLILRWKERVTFPRTGYVELRQPSKSVRVAVVVVAAVVAFAIGLLVHIEDRTFREWFPLGLGLVLAAGMLHASWKMRSLRLALLSSAIVAIGITAFVLHLKEDLSFALTMLAAGSACVLEGLLLLRGYLRAHPTPAGEAQ